MQTLTTTIKREFFREIAAGRKRVERREMKAYWRQRLERLQPPFLLRLINGMAQTAPRLTVRVERVVANARTGYYELQLGELVELRNWDLEREAPADG